MPKAGSARVAKNPPQQQSDPSTFTATTDIHSAAQSATEVLRHLYQSVLTCKLFADCVGRGAHGGKRNKFGKPHPGNAASAAATTFELGPADVICTAPDAVLACLGKNVPIKDLLTSSVAATLRKPGRARRKTASSAQTLSWQLAYGIVPPTVPFPAQLDIATGVALSFKFNKSPNVVLVHCGHTRVAVGLLQQVLEYAHEHKLPLVLVFESKWNESLENRLGLGREPALDSLVFGVPRIPVDGSDAVAIYRVSHEAIHRARNGIGPSLIDCKMSSSSKAMQEGLLRLERYMNQRGAWDDDWKSRLDSELKATMQAALRDKKSRSKKARKRSM